MLDSTIDLLSHVAVLAGGLASLLFAVQAVRQPEQRKANIARAMLFGLLAVAMLFLF